MPTQNNKAGRPETIDWARFDKLLSTMPDETLAAKIGCSGYAVLARRRKLNMPSYTQIAAVKAAGFNVTRKSG